MAVSLKSQTLKTLLKTNSYRNYETFDENRFKEDLTFKLDSIDKLDHPLFKSIFMSFLNAHAPVTTKSV